MANEEWVRVAESTEIPEVGAFSTTYEDKKIAIFFARGKYYALEDWCPHIGAMLSEGKHDGYTVTCPLHGVVYSVTTGAALSERNWGPARAFPVRIVDGFIEIDWSKRRYTPAHP